VEEDEDDSEKKKQKRKVQLEIVIMMVHSDWPKYAPESKLSAKVPYNVQKEKT
jgi:hypothetical protein